MARSAEHIAQTLEEALVALKHDPSQPVKAHVDESGCRAARGAQVA